MKIKFLTLLAGCLLCLPVTSIFAQEKSPVKFGKVTPEDFDLSGSKFDPEASAVIIADIGSSEFEGNAKGWFTLIYQRKRRIKILNKNGFDVANDAIQLYSRGQDEEKLVDFKASTYNLENGRSYSRNLMRVQSSKRKFQRTSSGRNLLSLLLKRVPSSNTLTPLIQISCLISGPGPSRVIIRQSGANTRWRSPSFSLTS